MATAASKASKASKTAKTAKAPGTSKASKGSRPQAPDATDRFFTALGGRGHEPLLLGAEGSIRFDVGDGDGGECWFVAIRKGDVVVSRKKVKADAVVRLDRDLCDRLVTGRANAMAAMLRGLISAEGDLALVILFQRLFPGPPRSGKKAS